MSNVNQSVLQTGIDTHDKDITEILDPNAPFKRTFHILQIRERLIKYRSKNGMVIKLKRGA